MKATKAHALDDATAAKLRGQGSTADSPDGKPAFTREMLTQLGDIMGRAARVAIDAEIRKLRAELAKKPPARLSPEYLRSLVDTIGGVIRKRLDQDAEGMTAAVAAARSEVANLQNQIEFLQRQIDAVRGVTESTIEERDEHGRLVSTATTRSRYVG
jgi:uncharacterized small protein (DUF1192 family)